jgi:hypothetical protein
VLGVTSFQPNQPYFFSAHPCEGYTLPGYRQQAQTLYNPIKKKKNNLRKGKPNSSVNKEQS